MSQERRDGQTCLRNVLERHEACLLIMPWHGTCSTERSLLQCTIVSFATAHCAVFALLLRAYASNKTMGNARNRMRKCEGRSKNNPRKKRRGEVLLNDERMRKRRVGKTFFVRDIPPNDRRAHLRKFVSSGRVSDESCRVLQSDARKIRQKRSSTNDNAVFGAYWQLHHKRRLDMNFITHLVESIPFQPSNTPSHIEGFHSKEGKATSPWLLDSEEENSPLHNDIHGQPSRDIPGSHEDMLSLFYCVEGDGLILKIYDRSKLPETEAHNLTKLRCKMKVVSEVPVSSGVWVIFPAKQLHEVVQVDNGIGKHRLVFSGQYLA